MKVIPGCATVSVKCFRRTVVFFLRNITFTHRLFYADGKIIYAEMNSLNPRTILTRGLLILIAVLLLVERSDAWRRRRARRCTAVSCVVSSWTSWSTCIANCGATGSFICFFILKYLSRYKFHM